jgi:hypothetical protein
MEVWIRKVMTVHMGSSSSQTRTFLFAMMEGSVVLWVT